MSELEHGVPSGGEGTVAISDDGDDTVLPAEVGVWFIQDDPEFEAFECDACGWQLWRSAHVPLSIYSDTERPTCEGCGSTWAFLLGIIDEHGQTRTVTADEVERLTA